MLSYFLNISLTLNPTVEWWPEGLELVMPERVGPGLVEELRQIGYQSCVLPWNHQIELAGVHADHLLQTLDLDVALGEVGDAADQATLVEHDVEVVAVAFVVERVVDHGLEHALFLKLCLLGRAFLQHGLHFEEVEAVEHDCAGHFGLRELRGFGVGFGLFALLTVECAYETFADFLADFARVEAFHAQRTAVHQSALTSAEFTVRATGPDGWVGCFEIFVNNEASILDQTTFVNEVEITIFNIFGTAAYAQTTFFDINCPLWTFFFLLL
jgi:hypothetical protein